MLHGRADCQAMFGGLFGGDAGGT